MRANLYALFWTTPEASKIMPAGASIITTAWVQAYDPSTTIMHYATTKAGIVAFTKALTRSSLERHPRQRRRPWSVLDPLNPSGGSSPEKVEKFGQGSASVVPDNPSK